METELASASNSTTVAPGATPAIESPSTTTTGAATPIPGATAINSAEAKEAAANFPPFNIKNGEHVSLAGLGIIPAQPRLQNDAVVTAADDNDDDEPAVARPFHRTNSPEPVSRSLRTSVTSDEDDDDHAVGGGHSGIGGGNSNANGGPSVPDAPHNGDGPGAAATSAHPQHKKKARVVHKMHKFSLYETASRFYIVGGDVTEKRYRILKIDRTAPPEAPTPGDESGTEAEEESELSIRDDKTVYSLKDMNQLLDTIDDGNKGTGGLKLRCTTWGLLGFIKFTGTWYMLLITKKSTVAMIGGHYVYQIEGTELIPLTPRGYKADQRSPRVAEENRFLAILNNLDLTRSFYYSYSYDITRTLQHNITREREALRAGMPPGSLGDDYNAMFVWNSHLLKPMVRSLVAPYDWCRPIIHGYIDQAALSIYGRTAHITIIARRSRFFAGARFLKRGANDLGYVANDVETEQIVSEALTTSFHAPGPRFYASPTYTSYVQHRGSIPLYWTQDNTGVTPKPPIELNLVDPFYSAAALHFDNLFERYGAPVYALDLVKSRERTPRESKLLEEYTRAIDYLNQFLPEGKRIVHRAWDMSRAAKSRDQDVISTLEGIAKEVLTMTGFFHNGSGTNSTGEEGSKADDDAQGPAATRVQNGVARTNCIDCLDRTNAAQFVIGKRALGAQLHALGMLADQEIAYDTDAVNLFTHMWHDHGDTIAVQYGGSQLVNTMATYRKINQWTSHSRDMIESFKRYYTNAFQDGQRQEAYNLFLGNYIYAQGQPMLWDLATDYYLHHADPRNWLHKPRRHYINWYTPEFLRERTLPPYPPVEAGRRHGSGNAHGNGNANAANNDVLQKPVSYYDDYWLEYYRPSTLSSFLKMFPFKMKSTIKYIPVKATQEGYYDLSPFRVRVDPVDPDNQDAKGKAKKDAAAVALPTTSDPLADDSDVPPAPEKNPEKSHGFPLQRWLHSGSTENGNKRFFNNSTTSAEHGPPPPRPRQQNGVGSKDRDNDDDDSPAKVKASALEKSRAATWTFRQVVHESLNPTVSVSEAEDYAHYIAHPQNLPLVVSAETPLDEVDAEYQEYINGSWQDDGLTIMELSSPAGHEDEYAVYEELLKVGDNPLTVTEEDAQKKRYKAYRKWLRGKSLFKQQPVD